MNNDSIHTNFSLNELQSINETINNMYSRVSDSKLSLSLSDFSINFLNDISNQILFDKGNVMFYSRNDQIDAFEVTSFFQIGWNEDDLENYINHYVHIDDVLSVLAGEQEIAFINGNIFSSREQTKYFKEFIKPAQLINSIDANIPFNQTQDIKAIIGLFRDVKKEGFTPKDLEIVKTIQPHLCNALSLYSERKQNANVDFMDFFSNIESICVCVLNEDLKLVTYNSAFQINIKALGYSSLVDNEVFKKLQDLCVRIKKDAGDNDYHKSGQISIEIDEQTYPVEIVYSKQGREDGVYVCLILTDNYAFKFIKFQTQYHLSKRECEIINLILKYGLTNEAISRRLYISTSTVKKHLTAAYRKIGVHNQKQLQTLFRQL